MKKLIINLFLKILCKCGSIRCFWSKFSLCVSGEAETKLCTVVNVPSENCVYF